MTLRSYLPEVLLGLQQLLLTGCRVGEQMVPTLHKGSVACFNSLGLHVLGSQQLILEGCDVGDALLLEGLQACIKCLLLMSRRE